MATGASVKARGTRQIIMFVKPVILLENVVVLIDVFVSLSLLIALFWCRIVLLGDGGAFWSITRCQHCSSRKGDLSLVVYFSWATSSPKEETSPKCQSIRYCELPQIVKKYNGRIQEQRARKLAKILNCRQDSCHQRPLRMTQKSCPQWRCEWASHSHACALLLHQWNWKPRKPWFLFSKRLDGRNTMNLWDKKSANGSLNSEDKIKLYIKSFWSDSIRQLCLHEDK